MALFEAKLTEEELKEVNGGYIYEEGADRSKPYEVIDDITGEVLSRNRTYASAIVSAENRGQSTRIISWNELERLRGN